MQVLDNGDYKLLDGRVIPRNEVAKLHLKAPVAEGVPAKPKKGLDLREGQSSGPIPLND